MKYKINQKIYTDPTIEVHSVLVREDGDYDSDTLLDGDKIRLQKFKIPSNAKDGVKTRLKDYEI